MRRAALAFGLVLAASASSAHAGCADDLFAMWDGMKNKPYHLTSVTTANGEETRMQGKAKLPEHMDITMPQGRMVMTPEGVWMQQGGQWMQMPSNVKAMMKSAITQGMAVSKKGTSNVKCLGKKPFQGGSYDAISFTTKGAVMGINSTSASTVYVNDVGQPVGMVIDGEAMGVKSKTVQTYDFDDSIVIKAPQ